MAENIQGFEASPGVSSSACEEALKGRYRILREIGKGTFGCIYLAIHELTASEVAVKVIQKSSRCLHLITSEVEVMRLIRHQHTVQLMEVIDTPSTIFLIMEFVGGGQLPIGLGEEEARPLFRQVLLAIHYCHQEGIIHRDLKPDNILLDKEGNIKLIDFGLSRKIDGGQQLTSFCGTLEFCAPETYEEQPYGPEVDIWGLGVLLHFMLTETLPFKGNTYQELKEQIVRGQYVAPTGLSIAAQHLLAQLLTVDQADRPTAADILTHPWVVQGEYIPPPPEPLHPKEPNTFILKIMEFLGYDPRLTWISVSNRLFNHLMATYNLFHLQVRQGAIQVRRERQKGVAPPPTPAFPPPSAWRASEPARPASPLLSGHSLGQEEITRSLPAIPWDSVWERLDSLPGRESNTSLPSRESATSTSSRESATSMPSLESTIRMPSNFLLSQSLPAVHQVSPEDSATIMPSPSPPVVQQLSPKGSATTMPSQSPPSQSPPAVHLLSPKRSATITPSQSPPAVHPLSHKGRKEQLSGRIPTIFFKLGLHRKGERFPAPYQRSKKGKQKRSPSLPAVTEEGEENVAAPEQRSQGLSISTDKVPGPIVPSPHKSEASAPENTRGWRRAGRRILETVLRTCCSCVMSPKIRPEMNIQ